MMSKQHIHVSVEDAERGFKRFVDHWRKAETGTIDQAEIHLNFESFSMLASVLTHT
jgi:predicted transcriptional regulator